MPKPGRSRPDGPVKARNGPAGAKWEGGTSGKTVPEAGGFAGNPPATTRKALAALVQSILRSRDYQGPKTVKLETGVEECFA